MKITRTHNLFAATVGLLAFSTTIAWAADPLPSKGDVVEPAPRLILQITVDQPAVRLTRSTFAGGPAGPRKMISGTNSIHC